MMESKTFLYVEDDPLSREALTLVLKRIMKIETVYIFENSANFEKRVNALAQRPDIILLDIHMEPLTGFEMLKLLRTELGFADTKIVALTASVMNEEVDILRDSGFDGVIGKPIEVAMFPGLIAQVVNGESVWHVTSTD